jgi:hypothetical protein
MGQPNDKGRMIEFIREFLAYCLWMLLGIWLGAFAGFQFWNWIMDKKYEEWNAMKHCKDEDADSVPR